MPCVRALPAPAGPSPGGRATPVAGQPRSGCASSRAAVGDATWLASRTGRGPGAAVGRPTTAMSVRNRRAIDAPQRSDRAGACAGRRAGPGGGRAGSDPAGDRVLLVLRVPGRGRRPAATARQGAGEDRPVDGRGSDKLIDTDRRRPILRRGRYRSTATFSRRPVGKGLSMPTDSEQRPLRSPEPSRGGPDVDAAVQNAESDTQTEGVHRSAPPGQAVGDSRLEQMREVDTSGERAEPDIPEGPLPGEVGAGGAQRIVGARISDRVAGGAERPAGPPFDDDGSGAGASPGPD
jgi:hypothetical protein